MFRPKSSATSILGRSTPLGAKDRKNLRQQFLTQFPHACKEDFDLVCPVAGSLTVFSVKGVTCDIYVCDSVPIFITHSSKKKSAVLTPTVFTLWKLPDLLPRMLCQKPTFGFISRGADFMIPGLVNREQIEHFTLTGEKLPPPLLPAQVSFQQAASETEESPHGNETENRDTATLSSACQRHEDDRKQSADSTVRTDHKAVAGAEDVGYGREVLAQTTIEDTERSTAENTSPSRCKDFRLAKLEEDQVWCLACVGHDMPFAVGEVGMDFNEFRDAEKGKVLIVTHVIGDLLFKLCPSDRYKIPSEFQIIGDSALESLLSSSQAPNNTSSSEAPGSVGDTSPPGEDATAGATSSKAVDQGGKVGAAKSGVKVKGKAAAKSSAAGVSKQLKQISAYQPLNNVKEILQQRAGVTAKTIYTAADIKELLNKMIEFTYVKSLSYPSLGADADAAPPTAPASIPPYVEVVSKDLVLNTLCLSKKDRTALKETPGDRTSSSTTVTNEKVFETFLSQGFKKLTILAPEGTSDVTEGAVIIEGDAAITICVKKTKRFIRTQVANIHKFSNIDPKQLAEKLQKACAASATVAAMEDIKGNPQGVLVQGAVPYECQKFINKTYGIPLEMIVIN